MSRLARHFIGTFLTALAGCGFVLIVIDWMEFVRDRTHGSISERYFLATVIVTVMALVGLYIYGRE